MSRVLLWIHQHPRLAWVVVWVWVLSVCWISFLLNLGAVGLVDETEPLFAEAARQMVVTGDWITPVFNGIPRFDKPPLIYWLMAIGYQILGFNEWAIRLPSALAGSGIVIIIFLVLLSFGTLSREAFLQSSQQYQGLEPQRYVTAGLGAAMVALTPLNVVWARTGVSDMVLTFWITAASLSFFQGYVAESPRVKTWWYTLFYASMALGTLTKGPIGIVLPILSISSFLVMAGAWRSEIKALRPLRGSLILLVIAAPWYVLVSWIHGSAFINSFFGYHNLERFTQVVNNHSAPWYFYFFVILVGFCPFSVYLPLAIYRLAFWRVEAWRLRPRSTQLALLALSWFFSVLLFFNVAVTKLPSYLLPLMPAAAILVTLMWADLINRDLLGMARVMGTRLTIGCNLLIWGGLTWAMATLPQLLGPDTAAPTLVVDLEMSWIPSVGAWIWGITLFLGWILMIKQHFQWLWLINLIGSLGFTLLVVTVVIFFLDGQRQLPLRQLAVELGQPAYLGTEIIMLGQPKPSLVFYSQRPILFLSEPLDLVSVLPIQSPTVLVGTAFDVDQVGLLPIHQQWVQRFGAFQLIQLDPPITEHDLADLLQ